MAISGSCCSGYIYEMRGGTLVVIRGETRLRSAFDGIGDAAAKLRRGAGERGILHGDVRGGGDAWPVTRNATA